MHGSAKDEAGQYQAALIANLGNKNAQLIEAKQEAIKEQIAKVWREFSVEVCEMLSTYH